MIRPLVLVVLIALFCASALGCASTPPIPEASVMPSGASYEGVWYSPQFEQMYLRRSGDEVRGIYTYKYGGTLEGQLSGNRLLFDWIDPGDTNEARRASSGKGYFFVTKRGDEIVLSGRWGYGDSRDNGGPWEATRVRDLDGSDPRNLEEFRERSVR